MRQGKRFIAALMMLAFITLFASGVRAAQHEAVQLFDTDRVHTIEVQIAETDWQDLLAYLLPLNQSSKDFPAFLAASISFFQPVSSLPPETFIISSSFSSISFISFCRFSIFFSSLIRCAVSFFSARAVSLLTPIDTQQQEGIGVNLQAFFILALVLPSGAGRITLSVVPYLLS